jgi:hypothetical protein
LEGAFDVMVVLLIFIQDPKRSMVCKRVVIIVWRVANIDWLVSVFRLDVG